MPEQKTLEEQASRNRRGRELLERRRARVGDPLAKFLLWLLDDCAGLKNVWEDDVRGLADLMEIDRRTLMKKARLLAGLSLIEMEQTGPWRYRFRLVRSNIAEASEERAHGASHAPLAPITRPRREPRANSADHAPLARDTLYRTKQNETPTPPTGEPWAVVEKAMVDFGIQETEKPLGNARQHGCSPESVLQILRYARGNAGAWSAGKVRRRIINLFPDQDPADEAFWPPRDRTAEDVDGEFLRAFGQEQLRELVRWASEHAKEEARGWWRARLGDSDLRYHVDRFISAYRGQLIAAWRAREGVGVSQ